MEIFLFILKLLFVMIEIGIIAFLIMLLWWPLKWSSIKKFSSYSPRERAMLVLVAVLVVAVIFATVTTVDYFFFSQGMSCLIPFFVAWLLVFCSKFYMRYLRMISLALILLMKLNLTKKANVNSMVFNYHYLFNY